MSLEDEYQDCIHWILVTLGQC